VEPGLKPTQSSVLVTSALVMVTKDDFSTGQPSVFFGMLLLLLTALGVILSYLTLDEPQVTSWKTLGAFLQRRFCWMLVALLIRTD
jgi:hypothetical protein